MKKEINIKMMSGEYEVGDFVKCVSCETLQLIKIGSENCCKCNSNNLMWVDENKPENNIIELKQKDYNFTNK